MKVYILLILAHIVGDIFLQRNSLIRKILKGRQLSQLKRKKIKYLALHAILYALPVVGVLFYWKNFFVYKLLIVIVSHFVIDYVKCYMIIYKDASLESLIINCIDQLLHIGILLYLFVS